MLDCILRTLGFPVESMRKDAWLLPNKISYVRIGLFWVPAVILGTLGDTTWGRIAAFVMFVLVAATDGIDGYLARRRGETSEWGTFIDPVADKLLVVATAITVYFVDVDRPDAWLFGLFLLVSVAREVTLAPLIWWRQRKVVPPTLLGKVKMVVQSAVVVAWLLPPSLVTDSLAQELTEFGILVVLGSWLEYLYRFVLKSAPSAWISR